MDVIVSICVPVYGVEKYIERCARSLFEQTYAKIEYIFVDDCTKDNSISILERVIIDYPERKKAIKIIHHEKNKGLAGARNTAVEVASGEFIMWVDSDDYIEKNAVELSVSKQKEGNYDIVRFNAIKYQNGYVTYVHTNNYKSMKEYNLAAIRREAPVCVWGGIIRRDLYIKNNIRAEEGVNMGEDYQVMPRLIYFAKSYISIDRNLYHYDAFTNSNSVSHRFTREMNRQIWRAYDILAEFFEEKGEDYRDALNVSLLSIVSMNLVISTKTNDSDAYFDEAKKRLSQVKKELWISQPFGKRLMFYIVDYRILFIIYVKTTRFLSHLLLSIKYRLKK